MHNPTQKLLTRVTGELHTYARACTNTPCNQSPRVCPAYAARASASPRITCCSMLRSACCTTMAATLPELLICARLLAASPSGPRLVPIGLIFGAASRRSPPQLPPQMLLAAAAGIWRLFAHHHILHHDALLHADNASTHVFCSHVHRPRFLRRRVARHSTREPGCMARARMWLYNAVQARECNLAVRHRPCTCPPPFLVFFLFFHFPLLLLVPSRRPAARRAWPGVMVEVQPRAWQPCSARGASVRCRYVGGVFRTAIPPRLRLRREDPMDLSIWPAVRPSSVAQLGHPPAQYCCAVWATRVGLHRAQGVR